MYESETIVPTQFWKSMIQPYYLISLRKTNKRASAYLVCCESYWYYTSSFTGFPQEGQNL